MTKGKEIDDASSIIVAGTFEDPHKHTFNIKDLSANSVILYPDQAQITRDIEGIQLKAGVNEVTIKGLTGYCQEHSVKVEGKGDAIITDMVVESYSGGGSSKFFGGNGFSKQALPVPISSDDSSSEESESESDLYESDEDPEFAEVRKIDDEIQELRDELVDAQEQLKNSEIQLAALEKYGNTITAEVAQPEIMTQFLEMYQESRQKLYEQNKKATATISRVNKELFKKEKERIKKNKAPLAARIKASKRKSKERAKKDEKRREKRDQKNAERALRPYNYFRVKVMIEAVAETEASLTIKYLVYQASWHPKYDLRLDSISKTGQIVYRAHFSNKTYENWKDAKIIFSSSAQTFGGLSELVPTMKAWTVSLQKDVQNNGDATSGLYSIREQDVHGKKNAALQDYQMQLMLLEQQNKKRLMMGKGDQNQQAQIQAQAQAQAHVQQAQQAQILQQQHQLQQQQMMPQQKNYVRPAAGGLFGNANNNNNNNNALNPFGGGFGQAQQQAPQASGGFAFGSTIGDAAPQASAFGAASVVPARGGGGGGEPSSEKLNDFDFDSLVQDPANDDGASTLAPNRASMIIAESSSSESYGMTTTYEIGGLKTIKSSPVVRRQVISTIELPTVTFSSIAVAKLRAAAFLKARFKNVSKYTFLRGVAGLTVDGSFLGQTNLPHCPPDDTISLSLGVDTGVHVSYAKPTLVSSSQGFISIENVHRYKRSIFIHNAKSQALTLTVLDQVPVSEDERLKINVVAPKGLKEGGGAIACGAPGQANLDNKWGSATAVMKSATTGEITYTVKLEKGRSCKLPLEYEVKLPNGEKFVGLT